MERNTKQRGHAKSLLGNEGWIPEEISRSQSVSAQLGLAREVLIEKVKQVLARQPELEEKIGFAFRDREKVTDRELETILEHLQELEQREVASQSSKR